ncbi:NADH-ubiquinone oxidoreductase chain L [Buchnera aphidicola (Nipponaphis monzeni)]|uniref:NADH-ubiquinone oxidoreductase chain L n=1 Tax=Buchnera aphidicola (Nipponaphis monzeni) TaxID=2495405 RepID=A0A455T9W5_9GAMM|nr:NADH-quinone oxidoreductase subunit L [Buchnera aphidicola]BBI01147.1 NADH-ubiquinone oxidoreductase chain L [Buchnera aphidicola (Nipponaphis monzeni)]
MSIIYLTIFFPLAGFILLTILNTWISRKFSCIIGVSTIFIALLSVIYINKILFSRYNFCIEQKLFNWINLGQLNISLSILIDQLSLTMLTMVIAIGFIIHLFSCWYIKEKISFFFAYTNLFIFSMTILILSSNFVLMYLGWEGVGICSYLLIGFYNKKLTNGLSAMKAFLFAKISDIFLIIGILFIYVTFSSFNFKTLEMLVNYKYIVYDTTIINVITILLLLSAMSKSAQISLHTWLIDAMVGPTPVSALIHAATMVTVGVYLIARNYYFFVLNPNILVVISLIGLLTLIMASCLALIQNNIKKILAYSTISQIGYMFLGLGVQAWSASIIHLLVHAVFKALLFLSAGSVIVSSSNEQNIFKMGGLYNKIPLTYVAFLFGGISLISIPLITSSFYSKDEILYRVLAMNHTVFFYISLIGVFLTSLYIFRLIFNVFHGKKSIKVSNISYSLLHHVPLFILMLFSTTISIFIIPKLSCFPTVKLLHNYNKLYTEIISSVVSIIGVFCAYFLWKSQQINMKSFNIIKNNNKLLNYYLTRYSFDNIYYVILIKPFQNITYLLKNDPFKILTKCIVRFIGCLYCILTKIQIGYLKWYVFVSLNNILTILIFVIYLI